MAARPQVWDPRLFWATLALVVIILFGALVLAWLNRWRKRSEAPALAAKDQLAHFRELYEEGELSQEEYDRIRTRLTGQLRKELNVPEAPPKEATPEQPQPPPAQPEPGTPPA